jgi:hypothetical protein
MRWFRRLTGSTYDGKPIAEALGGASEAGAEAGWLARGYMVVRDFAKRHYKVALGAAAGAAVLAAAERADASPIAVPIDYRADTPVKIVGLKNYGALASETVASTRMNKTNGPVTFDGGGDVPANWILWFLDEGEQPVGYYVITTPGWHDFIITNYGIFGDLSSTPTIDEGATVNDTITIVAQSPLDKFFESYYVGGLTFSGDEIDRGALDIVVTNNEITPEPATLALMGIGAGVAALTRRRRKFQPEMDSDLGKPVKS